MRHRFLARGFLLFVMTTLLLAHSKSGDKLLGEGRDAEVRQQWDRALELYEQALSREPGNPEYQLSVRRVRFQAGQAHVEAGQKLRQKGDLAAALQEFQKAYAIDPSSSIAQQERLRTAAMMAKQSSQKEPAAQRGLTPAERAHKDLQQRLSELDGVPRLKPLTTSLNTLKISNQPATVLYETVGKLAGINTVFDADVKAQLTGRFTVDLSNHTLDQALNYLAVVTKTFWKPLSANTIFVTLENSNKRRDYEDQAVKVFYLQNTTSAQEVTDISTALRTIIDLRRVFVYAAQNAIFVRGSADQVALAEKMVYDMDKAKSEVIVDVIVMSASKERTHDIAAGLTYGSGSGVGLSVPVALTSGTTTTSSSSDSSSTSTTTSIGLNQLGKLSTGDFSLTLPGAQFSLLAGDTKTKILQSPQVRAADNQKASLKVGERIPIATGSYQSATTVTTTSVSPLVSTQYNYQDVGVNVDLTPHVHGQDEVSMHVEIEISNVDGYSSLGGLSQPIIGQRKIVHDVRMHEGEVSLLGGLQQTQNSRTNSGLPGLVKVPFLRALFGEDKRDDSGSDLLIALIPHIIRAQNLDEIDMQPVSVGNDTLIQMHRRDAPVTTGPPATPVVTPAFPPVEAGAPPQLRLSAPVATVKPGQLVTVILQADNLEQLTTAQLGMKFDPHLLSLQDVKLGGLLAEDSQKVTLSQNILNDRGECAISLKGPDGGLPLGNSGALLTFTFQAREAGKTVITLPDIQIPGAGIAPVIGASVTIQPD